MEENYIQRMQASTEAYKIQHLERKRRPKAYYFADPDSDEEAEEPGPDPYPIEVIEEEHQGEGEPNLKERTQPRRKQRGNNPKVKFSPEPMEEEAEPDIPARETEEQDMPNAEAAERSNEMEQDFEKVDLNDRSIELPALVGCQDWIRQL
jgi:hypothetical protein